MRAFPVVAGLLFLALVPTSSAQSGPASLNVDVRPYEGRLMPEVEEAVLRVDVAVVCPPAYASLEPSTVDLRLGTIPSFANIWIEPNRFHYQFSAEECVLGGAKRAFESTVRVSVTRDAPAYYDGVYQIVAHVHQPGVMGPQSTQSSAWFAIKNDYMPQVEVRSDTLQVSVPARGHTSVPFEIINHGNGPTRTRVTIQPDPVPGLDILSHGSDLVLESRAGKGASARYKESGVLELIAGDVAGIYPFQARFVSGYDGASEDALVEENVLAFAIVVEGEAEPQAADDAEPGIPTVSAPMLPIMALLLVGVALLRRRLG